MAKVSAPRAYVPLRLRQQVLLHPGDGFGERLHDGVVGGVELLEQVGVLAGGLLGPVAHRVAVEADRALAHADGQVGELLRRIVHVGPQRLEHRRGGLQPGDDRAQPGRGRGEVALHEAVDRAGRRADVAHRVLLPVAHDFQVEQLGLASGRRAPRRRWPRPR